MPTSRISAQLLAGALPGLKQGAQAFAGGGMAFDQARDKEMNLQSQLAQRLAATQLATAKASELQRHAASQAPTALRSNALLSNGIPLDAADDVQTFLQTGKLGAQYDALPADQEGPVLPRPGWESKLGGVGRQLAAMQTAIALGDKNSENVAKATHVARSSALSDAIQAGTADPSKVAAAEYAVKGSAPFHFSEYGVGNNLTGELDNTNGVAQLFAKNRQAEIGAREAQAGASRASAANSYAAAGQHRAATDKIRQDVKSGDITVQPGPNGEIWLVNKLNGLSRKATDAEGAAISGKGAAGKEIPTSVAGKMLEGRQSLTNIDAAIQAIQSTPSAMGVTNAIPGAQTVKQLWASPEEIGTRAKVANIGSLTLHDRSGAAVTASEFPRLAPFIPSASDTPEAAETKLKEMKRIAEEEMGLYVQAYSPENGYRKNTVTNAAPAGGGGGGGFKYIGPVGK